MKNKAIYTAIGISLLAFWLAVGMAIYLVMG
jgi:hypothetical protein